MALAMPDDTVVPSNPETASSSTSSPLTTSPDLIYTLLGHTKSPTSISFSPCGTLLATSSADTTIKLWSVPTGCLVHTFASHTAGVNDLTWSSDSLYLASASDDRSISIFNVVTHTLVRAFSEHTSYVLCLAYNPQSTLLVSGSFDETVRLWNVTRNKCHRVISAHSDAVTGVGFDRDGMMVVSCSYDGSIRLWDTTTGACLKTIHHKDQSPLGGVCFTPSGAQVLSSSLDNTIRMWDIYNSKIVKTYTGHSNAKVAITARLCFNPTSTDDANTASVVSPGEDGKVTMWDLQSKQIVRQWQAHKHLVAAFAVHPTARVIATAAVEPENTIKLWFFANGSATT